MAETVIRNNHWPEAKGNLPDYWLEQQYEAAYSRYVI